MADVTFTMRDFIEMETENELKIATAYEQGKVDGRADAIDEINPFIDELQKLNLDWICDDLCDEFVNPKTDESWCHENCKDFNFECVKKWCELVRLKEQKNE